MKSLLALPGGIDIVMKLIRVRQVEEVWLAWVLLGGHVRRLWVGGVLYSHIAPCCAEMVAPKTTQAQPPGPTPQPPPQCPTHTHTPGLFLLWLCKQEGI